MTLRILYGGTFDPIHNGHLAVALHARDALRAEVSLLPAGDPPHKDATLADAGDRARMCELTVVGIDGMDVDERELRRDAPSWTIDTLRELRAEIGDRAPLALLVGADSFLGLPTWKDWRELPRFAHFVIAERPGFDLDGAMPTELADAFAARFTRSPSALHAAPAGLAWRLRQPVSPESATELRRRIASGEPWHDWVPPAVAGFIDHRHLYGATAASPPGHL
ncbi:nicotinate-nucleotide adenylyltransferase [Solilutibacter silvestris]|uniref:Probable nicotinate-nucleotide adenylyltransferase n=1 Tax=Solilutibacter silvestris TaxID=1645665 RepID=A0A2K1Q399_9GAMM|nr:nicotinate-nucleotide adenylyltransferase [Lysobacter silvestris]PNS09520.1 nicotinate (nicotinamide) nucleotide adenylyltransferase [Lysobacter silvestris]